MSVKISELPILDSLADNDVIAGVDTSANVTSKIEMATLKNYIDTNTQYTAGTNIDITNNVVSAPNVYNKTETDGLIDNLETSVNEQLEEKDEQIEELQSEVDSLSTIYNAFPTESGEGESLTLDDTAEVKFKKFDLKGNTSQYTTTGKNVLNACEHLYGVSHGITKTYSNGIYTLSGTASASWAYIANNVPINLPAGTYTFSITKTLPFRIYITLKASDNSTFILPINSGDTYGTADISKDIVSYELSCANMTSGTAYNQTLGIQLEKNSSKTDYESYTNGASPNPSYPQPVNVVSGDNEINVCGKNLLNMNGSVTYQGTLINFVGSEMIFSKTGQDGISASPRTQLIPYYANQGDVFTFSGTYLSGTINLGGSQDYRVYVYPVDINGNTNSDYKCQINLSRSSTTPNASASYTLPYDIIGFKAGAYFPSATNTTTGDVKIGLQLEKGSSASTYEPYQGNTYNIDLPVENLVDTPSTNSAIVGSGLTYSRSVDGTISVSGTSTRAYDYTLTTSYTFKAGETYTFYCERGGTTNFNYYILFNSNNGGQLTLSYADNTPKTRTIVEDQTVSIKWSLGNNIAVDYSVRFMVQKGSKANTYTPYGTTPIELCKIGNYQDYFAKSDGRNLFDKDNANYVNGWIDGTTMRLNTINGNRMFYIPCKPNTTYTISRSVITSSFRTTTYDSTPFPTVTGSNVDYTVGSVLRNDSGKTLTITTNANAKYLVVHYGKIEDTNLTETLESIMIEKGSSVSDYQPYGVGKWYLHKEIGKVVLNGSENWTFRTDWIIANGSVFRNNDYVVDTFNTGTLGYSNYLEVVENIPSIITNYRYIRVTNSSGYGTQLFIQNDYLGITSEDTTTQKAEKLKNWLINHNVIIYGIKPIPTNTEITYQPLIDQLNELEKAISYDSQTNISQVNNDKSFILDVTAIKSLQNVLDRIELLES